MTRSRFKAPSGCSLSPVPQRCLVLVSVHFDNLWSKKVFGIDQALKEASIAPSFHNKSTAGNIDWRHYVQTSVWKSTAASGEENNNILSRLDTKQQNQIYCWSFVVTLYNKSRWILAWFIMTTLGIHA